jgi:hypothetical protein
MAAQGIFYGESWKDKHNGNNIVFKHPVALIYHLFHIIY